MSQNIALHLKTGSCLKIYPWCNIKTQSPFQRQKTIIILDYSVLDPETFYNNSLSIIATAAIAEIQLYKKKYRKMYTFCNDNIQGP